MTQEELKQYMIRNNLKRKALPLITGSATSTTDSWLAGESFSSHKLMPECADRLLKIWENPAGRQVMIELFKIHL